jgi:hypothetical protein
MQLTEPRTIVNPIRLRHCRRAPKPWRRDFKYHRHNHHYLWSMVWVDPLGPSNTWARRAVFFTMAMLLFLLVTYVNQVCACVYVCVRV